MKTRILTSALLFLMMLSCNKKAETETVTVETPEPKPAKDSRDRECFQLVKKNDTIMLNIAQNSNNVNGELHYHFHEKDANMGTISGIFIGDTLIADYTFKSEGMTSVRETIFVRKGNTLVQGIGEMEEKESKQVFKYPKALTFDNSIVLEKIDCD